MWIAIAHVLVQRAVVRWCFDGLDLIPTVSSLASSFPLCVCTVGYTFLQVPVASFPRHSLQSSPPSGLVVCSS